MLKHKEKWVCFCNTVNKGWHCIRCQASYISGFQAPLNHKPLTPSRAWKETQV